MQNARIRNDEIVGLGVAAILHVALLAGLLVQPDPGVIPEIEPVTVSLADDIGLEATAPKPVSESRAATAPVLSDDPAPPAPLASSAPLPEPVRSSTPTRTERRPTQRETTDRRQRRRPDREQARPTPPQTQGRASRINEDFLGGAGSSRETSETRAPAQRFGRAERASLSSAITRQLRRHWTAPNGVEAEKLVSIVSWRLNPDGSLNGRPRCKNDPASVTASNRPQADLHCERAIRAVQLAAPFNLPEQFYRHWDDLEWQFDRRL